MFNGPGREGIAPSAPRETATSRSLDQQISAPRATSPHFTALAALAAVVESARRVKIDNKIVVQ